MGRAERKEAGARQRQSGSGRSGRGAASAAEAWWRQGGRGGRGVGSPGVRGGGGGWAWEGQGTGRRVQRGHRCTVEAGWRRRPDAEPKRQAAELRPGAEVRWEYEGERISKVDKRVTSNVLVKRNRLSKRTAHITHLTYSNILKIYKVP